MPDPITLSAAARSLGMTRLTLRCRMVVLGLEGRWIGGSKVLTATQFDRIRADDLRRPPRHRAKGGVTTGGHCAGK